MIYSQFIGGGCIPIGLALEEAGYDNYLTNNLFHNKYKSNLQVIKEKDYISYNNWLLIYINCNFSMKELEFEIVLSDSYYQFANQKMLELL